MLVHRHSNSDDEQWAPVSDLMAVVMLVFMLIVMILLTSFNLEEKSNAEKCEATKKLLENKFDDKFDDWEAKLEDDLTIRFTNQVVLFSVGIETPSTEFARTIKEFFPAYMDVIREIKADYGEDEVLAIRIEGHTSSEHGDSTGPDDAFLKNMELSQDRAREIIKTALAYPEAVNYREIVLAEVRADGLSSSKLKCINGEEDEISSRRVEFKLLTDSCQKAGIYDKGEVLTNYCPNKINKIAP